MSVQDASMKPLKSVVFPYAGLFVDVAKNVNDESERTTSNRSLAAFAAMPLSSPRAVDPPSTAVMHSLSRRGADALSRPDRRARIRRLGGVKPKSRMSTPSSPSTTRRRGPIRKRVPLVAPHATGQRHVAGGGITARARPGGSGSRKSARCAESACCRSASTSRGPASRCPSVNSLDGHSMCIAGVGSSTSVPSGIESASMYPAMEASCPRTG